MVLLSVLALLVALGTLGYATRDRWRPAAETPESDLPDDVPALRAEIAALRLDLERALRHLSVVRYDAFADTGGHLSWSAALLDDAGSGVVLTSIHGRQDSRTYAKAVGEWTSEQPLSPEEESAISHARTDLRR